MKSSWTRTGYRQTRTRKFHRSWSLVERYGQGLTADTHIRWTPEETLLKQSLIQAKILLESFFPVMIRLRFILLSGNLFNNYRTHYVGWRFSRWHSRLTCTNLVIRFFEKLVGILASWGRTESRKRVFCGRIGTGAKFLNVLKAELPKLNLILYIGPFGRSKMSNEICQTEQVESTDWDAFDISN